MIQPNYVSREGLEKLKAELEHLRTVGRHEVAERIQQSRERGGTVSNADMVNNAVIIGEVDGARDTVGVGATVTLKNQNSQTTIYTITGSAEADPIQGKISNASPIGKSLLGKRVGEVTEVTAPAGKIRLEIVSIQ